MKTNYITMQDRLILAEAQEKKREQYLKWTLWIIGIYFGVHILLGVGLMSLR